MCFCATRVASEVSTATAMTVAQPFRAAWRGWQARNRRSAGRPTSGAICSHAPTARATSGRRWFSIVLLFIANTQLLERGIRTPVPIVDEHVALILQIFDAHLRRPESARGQIAEAVEEDDVVAESRVGIGHVRDLVEDGPALRIGERREPLVVTLLAQPIDDREAAA